MTIEIDYIDNKEGIANEKALKINKDIINNIIENKIEIIPNETCRFIYTKTMADIIESLTALCYETAKFNNYNIKDSFNYTTIFLNEVNVLSSEYNENMSKIKEISIKNLLNQKCKFTQQQKDNFVLGALDNNIYKFINHELLYQAMTHPSLLTEENIEKGKNYVNKSYQRLSYLGEAIIELYVSIFVYDNNKHDSEESLHKMRICGINHHIMSYMAINLNLDQCFLNGGGIKCDLDKYKNNLKKVWKLQGEKNKYKIPEDEIIDEEFVIILCELFHSYIGAIFVDCCDIEKTFEILDIILKQYLLHNATKDTFTEHPKVIILQEYQKRRHIFKKIRENGGNRVINKFGSKTPFRKTKSYEYQLIIDKYIIYSENIVYNRTNIKKAQRKALEIFKKICNEIDRRLGLRLNESKCELKKVMDYIGVSYKEVNN